MAGIDSETFRARAAGGQPTLNGWCSIPEPTVAEIMALQPWDTMTVDLQHGLLDFQRALDLIRTIQGHGKPTLARIPSVEENWLIMKLLDAGAGGLICPNISTPEDAARFVSACTYPPAGSRSYGPTRAVLLDADYAKTADRRIIRRFRSRMTAPSPRSATLPPSPALTCSMSDPPTSALPTAYSPA